MSSSCNFVQIGKFELTENKRTLWEVEVPPHLAEVYSNIKMEYYQTYNNYIIKISGTKVGMQGRITSYLCGQYPERKKEMEVHRKMSVTNAYIYNISQYLQKVRVNFIYTSIL